MSEADEKVRGVKGLVPKAVAHAQKMDERLGEALSSLYVGVWGERSIPIKYKHLIAFAIAASHNNQESTLKIVDRLAEYGATREEIVEVLEVVLWTSGVQVFTDIAGPVMREVEKRGL